MGSSRLPGKTVADISGKPLLWHIIERLSFCLTLEKTVVATTDRPEDEVIESLCSSLDIPTFRGSDRDVLDRYYRCAALHGGRIVVRITADDPFKDPVVIDSMVRYMVENPRCDYVSNTIKPTYPEGIDAEVFTSQALEKAWKEAKLPSQREHVTPYIWNNPELFSLKNLEHEVDLSHLRWTLDYPEDLRFALEVYKRLYVPGRVFLMEDILSLLAREPGLSLINSHIERNAGYKKSLLEDARQ